MSTLDRRAYSDPAVFEAELGQLFAAHAYVGSAFDLPHADDYLSFLIGNRAITVRNTTEGVRAFSNVCLHRNALIDPLGHGNRAFRCNYHGWSYNANGSLKNAPLANESVICKHQLTSLPLSESNGLYFLRSQDEPAVSNNELACRKASIALAPPFHKEVLDHACNWKLLVENVLEGYHLSHVHKGTFVSAGFTSTASYQYERDGGVSWSTMRPFPQNDKTKAMQRISANAGHYYHHAYIFPNLFLANTNGLIGFQSSLLPASPSTTRLEWSLFELPALSKLAAPIREHFKSDAVAFARAALLEDKVLVESCQLGLASPGFANQFQGPEGRIAHFHAMYQEKMRNADEKIASSYQR